MSAQMNKILNEIRQYPHCFDFKAGGDDLAIEAAQYAADGIEAGMDAETDPDGGVWPPLAAGYEAWKSQHYPGLPMAVLEGLMKHSAELQGELIVSPNKFFQIYGVTDVARDHAQWFQDPQGGNQPDRPFYAFNADAIRRLDDLFDDVFINAIA
jgi:hypothetical protein